MTHFSNCWFLTGPTASGKSRLAMALAKRFPIEIVAMDSMTLYRGMDIGTDKPSLADRARVKHHLIDILDPWESASVEMYVKWAREAVDGIIARGRQPLFVGGTPLYLKICLRGMFEGPPADPVFRQQLQEEANRTGVRALHDRLATVDPVAASRIHSEDLRRIIRALEVFERTGRRISDWQKEVENPANPAPKVACIVLPTAERYRRINARVLKMLNQGWIEEVKRLRDHPQGMSSVSRQAVGYHEVLEHLDGRIDYAPMVERIQTRTRQFSKRQMTWFRHLEECVRFEVEGNEDLIERLVPFFSERA